MLKSKVTVKFLPQEVAQKFQNNLSGANGVQAMFANKVAMDTNPYVPMDTGMLASSVIRASNFEEGQIIYDTPYAKRLYEGVDFKFSRDAHPQATYEWFEAAKRRCLEAWGEYAARLLGGKWRRMS